jgi:hypothetical protein
LAFIRVPLVGFYFAGNFRRLTIAGPWPV